MKKFIGILVVFCIPVLSFSQVFPFQGEYTITKHQICGIEYEGSFGDVTIQNPKLLEYTDNLHCGTDYVPAADKVDILSIVDGVVEDVYYEPGREKKGIPFYRGSPQYGGQIVIRHENGLLSFYGRLSRVDVKEGDKVLEGQKIGELSKDFKQVGYLEKGYHLHFELIIDPFDKNSAKLGIEGLPMKYYDPREIVKVQSEFTAGVWHEDSFVGYRESFSDNQGGEIKSSFHRGSDVTVPQYLSPAIVSLADGVIHSHYALARQRLMNGETLLGNKVYGGCIMVEHQDGIYTMYAHLSYTAGKEGSEIKKGDYVGTMGNTGLSSGKHLHFQMNYDPEVWFKNNLQEVDKDEE